MPIELNYRKVLVLDGDADTIDELDDALRDGGYQPVFVRRGLNAKKRVEDEKPGAIILELSLPDRDGRQVIKECKDDWDIKRIPIIVLSSYPNRLDRANREMVEAVFEKPADLGVVLDEVTRVINKARDNK